MAAAVIKKAVRSGAELIVIDQRQTELTRYASMWLRPAPGTETALIGGMIRVIVDESLDRPPVRGRAVRERPAAQEQPLGVRPHEGLLPDGRPERADPGSRAAARHQRASVAAVRPGDDEAASPRGLREGDSQPCARDGQRGPALYGRLPPVPSGPTSRAPRTWVAPPATFPGTATFPTQAPSSEPGASVFRRPWGSASRRLAPPYATAG